MLTGPNGLLKQAKSATAESIIGEEKERVAAAYNGATTSKYTTSLDGTVTAGEVQAELNKNKTKATAHQDGENIVVVFEGTGNVYRIHQNGTIAKVEGDYDDTNEQANIYTYTEEGYITGVKGEYIIDGMASNTMVASLNMPSIEVADMFWHYLVDELNGTLKIPNRIGDTDIIGISPGAFSGTKNLKHVIIADGIISIGKRAFGNCEILESVEFHSSMEMIGEEAFIYCDKLRYVTYDGSMEDWNKMNIDTGNNELCNVFEFTFEMAPYKSYAQSIIDRLPLDKTQRESEMERMFVEAQKYWAKKEKWEDYPETAYDITNFNHVL